MKILRFIYRTKLQESKYNIMHFFINLKPDDKTFLIDKRYLI